MKPGSDTESYASFSGKKRSTAKSAGPCSTSSGLAPTRTLPKKGATCPPALLRSRGSCDLAEAAALIDRAVAAKGSIPDYSPSSGQPDWICRYFLFAMGLAEYRQGRLDSAISVMKGEASRVMGPAPRLILAMAQYRQGESDEAFADALRQRSPLSASDWTGAASGEEQSANVSDLRLLRRRRHVLARPGQ